jgi:hypothetical protein
MSELIIMRICAEEFQLFVPKNDQEKFAFHARQMKCTRCLIRRAYIHGAPEAPEGKESIIKFTEAWDGLVADSKLNDKVGMIKFRECAVIHRNLWQLYYAGELAIERDKLEEELPYCEDENHLCEVYINE